MASTTKNEAKITIKVTVDKVKKRVVYAEADHRFVDILLSFMTLPLGTIVRLLGKLDDKKFDPLRSLNNVYKSLKDLPECYFSTEECKCRLLNPRSLSHDHCRNLKLKLDDTEPLKYFRCANKCVGPGRFISPVTVSTCAKAKCPECGRLMNRDAGFKNPNVCVGGGVFVSDIASFIVTDDLCVMPYTSASSFRLLTCLGITDQSCLEDITIDMGSEQILNLLKISLALDSVFTYLVFPAKINISIQDLVVTGQGSTLDLTYLQKNEDPSGFKILLEVSFQKSTGRLLFAEAKEDFIDFFFELLSVPLGTVIGELLNGVSSFTCMNNIFESISNMSVGRYLKSQGIKDMLLKPHLGQQYSSKHQVFPLVCTPKHMTDHSHKHKDPRVDRGLLKSGMFIVTDDLIITPSSSCSTMNILSSLKVSFDDIEKHEIGIGLLEGFKLLNASLKSCSTLTDSLKDQLRK